MNIKSYKKSLIVTMVLQILTLVLWFLPMFSSSVISHTISSLGESSYKAYGQTATFIDCFEGVTGILIFLIVMHLVSMVCVALPLKAGDRNRRRRFVVPKVSTFLTIGFWLIPFSSMHDTAKEYEQYGARGGLTFGGWLFVIAMTALVAMLFLLSYQSKTISEQKKRSEFEADAYARKTSGIEPIPEGGWRCSCGRANAAYVSSCTCGLCKASVQQQVE